MRRSLVSLVEILPCDLVPWSKTGREMPSSLLVVET